MSLRFRVAAIFGPLWVVGCWASLKYSRNLKDLDRGLNTLGLHEPDKNYVAGFSILISLNKGPGWAYWFRV